MPPAFEEAVLATHLSLKEQLRLTEATVKCEPICKFMFVASKIVNIIAKISNVMH